MAEEAGKASGIEKFDGTDFAYWRMQIEDYLYGRKLHLPLLGTKPESMKAEEWALLDKQVLGVIRLTLSRSVAHNVVKEKTTTDLMKALSGMYEKSSANNKVHLMKKLFNLKMARMHRAQHPNEFNTITNQLSSEKLILMMRFVLDHLGFFAKQLGGNEDGDKQFSWKGKAQVQ
ncbi:hypothetical protein AAG906_017940 [Vitis piasezkii]